MSNYGWTNADGEPIMDGAAYRFEQAIDAEYAEQRAYDDDYFSGAYDPAAGECCDLGEFEDSDDGWVCAWCESPVDPD